MTKASRIVRHGIWTVSILLCLTLATNSTAGELRLVRIEVTPTELELRGDRSKVQLIVTGFTPGDREVDVTRQATFSDSAICRIDKGMALPLQNGRDTIQVSVCGVVSQFSVSVANVSVPTPISFRRETLAVLTKQGCNGGACHGKPNGRGALELSLNAFDPRLDERSLVRGSFVRFTDRLVPEESLMLKKPTLAVPHGGGKRLRADGEPYRILRQWIQEGCKVDTTEVPQCVSVQVFPSRRVVHLEDGDGQLQLRVTANFSDGTQKDVTSIATYFTSNTDVADVDASGLVTGSKRGQSAVVVRYLDNIVSAQVTFVNDIPGFVWKPANERNYVDHHVNAKLHQLKYLPGEICDDATFLRRVSLDIRGLLPSSRETRDFLADSSDDKRDKLIDQFLDSPEYAQTWGMRLADLLQINRQSFSEERAAAYSAWVCDAVARNMPFDKFVSLLLTAKGPTQEVPAANFYRVAHETKQVAETVAQVFMGSRIMCAQCHNHPYESWTQDNYYQMASAFHGVDRRLKDEKKRLPAPEQDVEISVTPGRLMSNPRTGEVQRAWPVGVERGPTEDPRIGFANWLTHEENPFFARVAVNRLWTQLVGKGIVDPIDDFRSSNPAVNSELLDALAVDFIASGYDRKHVLRTILRSHAYQRSAVTNKFNESDEDLFSHFQVRLLSAETIQDAITLFCEGPEGDAKSRQEISELELQLSQANLDPNQRSKLTQKLAAARKGASQRFMTQQPLPRLTTFLKAFGQPERKTACACERRAEVTLDQALQLMNSSLVREQVRNAAEQYEKVPEERLAEELYLSALSRFPRTHEEATVQKHVSQAEDRRQAIEDLVWALINTHEFLFQH